MNNLCPQCGAPITAGATKCEYCGTVVQSAPQQQATAQQPQVIYVQQPAVNDRSNWPIKNKIVAALLAILLGGFGIHKFYLGQKGKGILYLIFCWTYIPAFIAFVDGILMLMSNDENFMIKYQCRLG